MSMRTIVWDTGNPELDKAFAACGTMEAVAFLSGACARTAWVWRRQGYVTRALHVQRLVEACRARGVEVDPCKLAERPKVTEPAATEPAA